ncbi:hypothetical protein BU25DRAFT_184490 [Macroventuria anomochaeta]|uniref:Uncharacterized protein n=1 Tax=Macroventuria anomochaeta TaxID=301207 RepID=A0ACB6RPJ5_9PLEO|nr:uncharacterized protein BU25DRAFT_184490 [Macroventuria anomochaeta]KAF2623187.1 hypothetical protein BU25DRAFT_184490 [Macroventuria anomochaeta]
MERLGWTWMEIPLHTRRSGTRSCIFGPYGNIPWEDTGVTLHSWLCNSISPQSFGDCGCLDRIDLFINTPKCFHTVTSMQCLCSWRSMLRRWSEVVRDL